VAQPPSLSNPLLSEQQQQQQQQQQQGEGFHQGRGGERCPSPQLPSHLDDEEGGEWGEDGEYGEGAGEYWYEAGTGHAYYWDDQIGEYCWAGEGWQGSGEEGEEERGSGELLGAGLAGLIAEGEEEEEVGCQDLELCGGEGVVPRALAGDVEPAELDLCPWCVCVSVCVWMRCVCACTQLLSVVCCECDHKVVDDPGPLLLEAWDLFAEPRAFRLHLRECQHWAHQKKAAYVQTSLDQ